MMNRRSLIRSLALAPVVLVASRLAFAQTAAPAAPAAPAKTPAAPAVGGLPALGETEPLAKAMQYVADANKASAARTDKKANCENCAKFNICAPADKTCKPAAKTAAQAPCEIFAGKSVAKAGWCLSWTKKV